MVAPWRIVSAQQSRLYSGSGHASPRTPPLLLLDIPEYRGRRGDKAADVLAGTDRLIVLAEIDVGDRLALAHLHGLGDLFLLGRVGGARKIVTQLLDSRIARPAERSLVAARVHEAVH